MIVGTHGPDLPDLIQVITTPPTAVTGILQGDKRSTGLVHIIGIDSHRHLFGGDPAAVTLQRPHLRTGVKGDAATLIDIDVRILLANNLIPGLGMTFNSYLVGHR